MALWEVNTPDDLNSPDATLDFQKKKKENAPDIKSKSLFNPAPEAYPLSNE